MIENNPNIKSEELAKELGVSLRTVKTVLKIMVEQKLIKRINGKRFGSWDIISNK